MMNIAPHEFFVDIKNTMRGWFFESFEIKNAISEKRMLNPSIDLSNICNLNCPYCYIEDKNSSRKIRKKGELTCSELEDCIKDMAECGAKTINIVGAGEPTLYPEFRYIIDIIHSLRLKTVVFSNGIYLSQDINLIDYLFIRNVSIVIKFNSMKSEIQDLMVGKHGYHKKRNKAIELLIDRGFTSCEPTMLGFDIILCSGIVDELKEIMNYCRINNIFPIITSYIPAGRTIDGYFSGYESISSFTEEQKSKVLRIFKVPNKSQLKRVVKAIDSVDSKFEIKKPVKFAYYSGSICTQLLGLYVDYRGDVWPCVAKSILDSKDNKPLGNIRAGSKIQDIWLTSYSLDHIRRTYNGRCPYKQIP